MQHVENMSNMPKDFDAIAIVVDWLDACRKRDLAALLDLYADDASLECVCDGNAVLCGRAALEAYWRPRSASRKSRPPWMASCSTTQASTESPCASSSPSRRTGKSSTPAAVPRSRPLRTIAPVRSLQPDDECSLLQRRFGQLRLSPGRKREQSAIRFVVPPLKRRRKKCPYFCFGLSPRSS